MKTQICTLAATLLFFVSANAIAQLPVAGPEFEVLKKDVGVWDAKVKMWTGTAEPEVSQGVETNTMIGDFWLVSDYEGQMMGMPFKGHGVFGYNAKSTKYSGSWVDNFSPNVTHLEGSYDKATRTMTYLGEGIGPDGSPVKHKLATVFQDDGTRVFTMHVANPDDSDGMVKIMETVYTKR